MQMQMHLFWLHMIYALEENPTQRVCEFEILRDQYIYSLSPRLDLMQILVRASLVIEWRRGWENNFSNLLCALRLPKNDLTFKLSWENGGFEYIPIFRCNLYIGKEKYMEKYLIAYWKKYDLGGVSFNQFWWSSFSTLSLSLKVLRSSLDKIKQRYQHKRKQFYLKLHTE